MQHPLKVWGFGKVGKIWPLRIQQGGSLFIKIFFNLKMLLQLMYDVYLNVKNKFYYLLLCIQMQTHTIILEMDYCFFNV